MEERIKKLDARVQDWMCKYTDKCKECDSYISISEHRLEQYNELMQKKKELEEGRLEVTESIQHAYQEKEQEVTLLRKQVAELNKDV